jgi:hypothetical protein
MAADTASHFYLGRPIAGWRTRHKLGRQHTNFILQCPWHLRNFNYVGGVEADTDDYRTGTTLSYHSISRTHRNERRLQCMKNCHRANTKALSRYHQRLTRPPAGLRYMDMERGGREETNGRCASIIYISVYVGSEFSLDVTNPTEVLKTAKGCASCQIGRPSAARWRCPLSTASSLDHLSFYRLISDIVVFFSESPSCRAIHTRCRKRK